MALIDWIKLIAPYLVELITAVLNAHKIAVTNLRDRGKL